MTTQVISLSRDRQHQQLLAEMRLYIAQESDKMADSARKLAGSLAAIPREKIDLAQVRGLESLAYGTDKVSDLTDLLKKRIGRDGTGERWAKDGVGQSLLNTLEGLREHANTIAGSLEKYGPAYDAYDKDLPRQIHLQLCREYLRHLVANFEFQRLQVEMRP